MGFFGGLGGILGGVAGALNPVGLLGTASAMGGSILDAIGVNQTNQTNQGIANQANQTTQMNNAAQLQMARENMALEEEFAKNGISWRIADAAKNGISPLAALGSTEPSYSPVSYMPSGPTSIPQTVSPLSSIGSGFSEAGQNISRALLAQKSPEQKISEALYLTRQQKENDLLDVQIKNAQLQLASHSSPPGLPAQAWMTVRNRDGSISVVPTDDAARASHGESFGPLMWSLHNGMIPSLQDAGNVVSGYWNYFQNYQTNPIGR